MEKQLDGCYTKLRTCCWRSDKETVFQIIPWDPKHGRRSRGRPATTFIDQLESDSDLSKQDLASVMVNIQGQFKNDNLQNVGC